MLFCAICTNGYYINNDLSKESIRKILGQMDTQSALYEEGLGLSDEKELGKQVPSSKKKELYEDSFKSIETELEKEPKEKRPRNKQTEHERNRPDLPKDIEGIRYAEVDKQGDIVYSKDLNSVQDFVVLLHDRFNVELVVKR